MKARYAVGDEVTVIDRFHPGHRRTPIYVRGKSGRIERVVGPFLNPETLAYGRTGLPASVLYRVRFRQREVWPAYKGPSQDTIDVEIYEHWLAPAGEARREVRQ